MKKTEQDMDGYIELLKSNIPGDRYQAVDSLLSGSFHKDAVIEALNMLINEQRPITYNDIPLGQRTGEYEKYLKMINAASTIEAACHALLSIIGPKQILDEPQFTDGIDSSGMLKRLAQWEAHITAMNAQGIKAAGMFKNRYKMESIEEVRVFGLGGSAAPYEIAAGILNCYRKSSAEIRVIHADSPNPDYVNHKTLVIFASFSGNTEETLNCYDIIAEKAGGIVVISKGGSLRDLALIKSLPFIQLPENTGDAAYVLQPRESVCLQLTAILSFLACLELPAGSNGSFTMEDLDIPQARQHIRRCCTEFCPETPYEQNPAKRLAFFLLYGLKNEDGIPLKIDYRNKRIPFVLTDENHAAIGHEVRTQLHERSKLNAAFYTAPEFLHNLIESIRANAEAVRGGIYIEPWVYYFIRSEGDQERVRQRVDKTIDLVFKEKTAYAFLNAEEKNPYHRALGMVYFNAYLTTYMAILNGHDPLPVPTMSWMKNVMSDLTRMVDEDNTEKQNTTGKLEIEIYASVLPSPQN